MPSQVCKWGAREPSWVVPRALSGLYYQFVRVLEVRGRTWAESQGTGRQLKHFLFIEQTFVEPGNVMYVEGYSGEP